ncbi:hypothetical protein ABGB12_01350 [Actinocorallia sp. B10E7]|uniref:hypothetical protein n=1 Tax=Actinocorallia sp. B10E7 TaxID=3153558 RepID=UPI00325ED27F
MKNPRVRDWALVGAVFAVPAVNLVVVGGEDEGGGRRGPGVLTAVSSFALANLTVLAGGLTGLLAAVIVGESPWTR